MAMANSDFLREAQERGFIFQCTDLDALGAAMGLPVFWIRARAISCAGQRMAIVSNPALARSEMGEAARRVDTRR